MEESEEGKTCTKSDICKAAANMPYLVDVKGALEDVSKDDTCGQAIVSDGNDVFIGAFLKENGMEHWFTHGIETNFGRWEKKRENNSDGDDVEDNVFTVVHQSTKYGGHSSSCPPNLCKSQVLRESLLPNTSRIGNNSPLEEDGSNTKRRPRIVYVGDGSNDACPALNVLNENDILLARDGKRISKPNTKTGSQEDTIAHDDLAGSNEGSSFPILSVLKKAKEKKGLVPKCRVYAWNSGNELRTLVRSLLDET